MSRSFSWPTILRVLFVTLRISVVFAAMTSVFSASKAILLCVVSLSAGSAAKTISRSRWAKVRLIAAKDLIRRSSRESRRCSKSWRDMVELAGSEIAAKNVPSCLSAEPKTLESIRPARVLMRYFVVNSSSRTAWQ